MDFQTKSKKIVDNTVDHQQLFINDSEVEELDRTKYLGRIIDRSLSWEEPMIFSVPKFLEQSGVLNMPENFYQKAH